MSRVLSARARRGWYLYDWANSAFATVIMAALLPDYFEKVVVPEGGVAILGTSYSATSLWGYASGLSSLLVFLLAPHLGALADASGRRRRWMLGFFLPGAVCTILLVLVAPGDVGLALLLAVFGARLLDAAAHNAFTIDEPAYVGTGLYLWQSGDYHYARVLHFHPPLAFHLGE